MRSFTPLWPRIRGDIRVCKKLRHVLDPAVSLILQSQKCCIYIFFFGFLNFFSNLKRQFLEIVDTGFFHDSNRIFVQYTVQCSNVST